MRRDEDVLGATGRIAGIADLEIRDREALAGVQVRRRLQPRGERGGQGRPGHPARVREHVVAAEPARVCRDRAGVLERTQVGGRRVLDGEAGIGEIFPPVGEGGEAAPAQAAAQAPALEGDVGHDRVTAADHRRLSDERSCR